MNDLKTPDAKPGAGASAWPGRLLRGTTRNWSLDWYYSNRNQDLENPDDFRKLHRPGQEWLMGLVLPPFQRPPAWDTDGGHEQSRRFMESAILGLPIGICVYNDTASRGGVEKIGDKQYFHFADRWLIDGQQRLRALDRFWKNEFPVFGYEWDQLPRIDRRKLLATGFDAVETDIREEAQLRELYDRLNYGGTPHTPEQRATRDGDVRSLPVSEDFQPPGPR